MSRTEKLANLAGVVVPFAGVLLAVVLLWQQWVDGVDLAIFAVMYLVTALGITVGFHRLFTHRSFETGPVVQFILSVLGSMAVQGPLLDWVAQHRRHHQHSDEPGDPHSPHHHGGGVLGLLRGLWHAHLGWIFDPAPPDLMRYVKDLQQSGMLWTVSSLFPVWVAVGFLVPAVLGGLLTGSWLGVWTGLVWGGLVRVFLVHHVTWSVNSVCHLWGFRPFRSSDQSRDNFVFGVLALGEGFHNAHHAFPTSARHGLRWWQPDVSYYVIRLLALVGLAWNVRLPTEQAQEQARRGR